jgi:hypothetical protein
LAAVEKIKMTDWKSHMDMLVEETIALTKSISVQSPPPPPTSVEPAPMPSVNLRDELRVRVSNFKAHRVSRSRCVKRIDPANSTQPFMFATKRAC